MSAREKNSDINSAFEDFMRSFEAFKNENNSRLTTLEEKAFATFPAKKPSSRDQVLQDLVEALRAARAALGIRDDFLPLGIAAELAHKIDTALLNARSAT